MIVPNGRYRKEVAQMQEKTADKILSSMYDLIAEIGYEKASINKICSNIGITKSSFYHFYESKEAAFLELISTTVNGGSLDFWDELFDAKDASTYEKKMFEIAISTLSAYEDDSKWRKVYAEITLQSERIAGITNIISLSDSKRLDELHEILKHGLKVRAFSSEFDAKLNAEILYSLYLGLDSAILYDTPIRAKDVLFAVLERMFKL